jgi:hypothetical protein
MWIGTTALPITMCYCIVGGKISKSLHGNVF